MKCNAADRGVWLMWRLAVTWRCRGGQRVSGRTGEGWMDSGHPPLCDQGSQSQTSRVGRGAMNAGLCPVRGHHIPLEPLCGAQQSGGEGRPGQGRAGQGRTGEAWRGNTGQNLCLSFRCEDHIKDACGSVPFK